MTVVRHVLLDRDGVLNRTSPSGWVTDVADWHWERGAVAALDLLAATQCAVSVVTNQSCIGRGLVAAEQVDTLHDWLGSELRERGVRLVGIFVCPHAPGTNCRCRKPASGLLLDALAVSGTDPAATMMVGDSPTDADAAAMAGVGFAAVATGAPGPWASRTVVHDDAAAALGTQRLGAPAPFPRERSDAG